MLLKSIKNVLFLHLFAASSVILLIEEKRGVYSFYDDGKHLKTAKKFNTVKKKYY